MSADLFPGVPWIESPVFDPAARLDLTDAERDVAIRLHRDGYAVIDFPDPELDARIDRIKARLAPRFDLPLADPAADKTRGVGRIQDAWADDADVRAIALNPGVLDLLAKLYGRPAFAFQTLNFPVGTQQAPHADALHFSSLPPRFMCGVWLAMEDVPADAGPLNYYPGSHRWPQLSNAMIGRRGYRSTSVSAQDPYEPAWQAMAAHGGAALETFLATKGQALIWTANLLHGGAPQTDLTRTRWSQVTHYFFDDCVYYTPAFSDETLGRLNLREPFDVATGQRRASSFLGEHVPIPPPPPPPLTLKRRLRRAWQELTRSP